MKSNSEICSLTHAQPNLRGLVLTAVMLLTQPLLAAGPLPIELKSCTSFAVLASSTITSTGGGLVYGDAGLYPAGTLGIPPVQIKGRIYNGGVIAAQAQRDLIDAIIAASPAVLPDGMDVGAELGGQSLFAGVYKSPSGAYGITTQDLTLTGGTNDVWVFQMGSTLTTGVDCKVILTNGAQARNVYWQVGSSATLGTSSDLKGTIMAYASITMNAGSRLEGRALAQTGAVTFNGTLINLPQAEAPVFTHISRTNNLSATVILKTTPYFPLTLQACPDLLVTNWQTLVTDIPELSFWKYTDFTATASVTQRFYRAFLTPY